MNMCDCNESISALFLQVFKFALNVNIHHEAI